MGEKRTSLLLNHDYAVLMSGQVVSDFGGWISQLAYPLLFLSLTGSPIQAGVSIALTNLPTFLFGLFAGAIIDSFDRRKVMIVCDIVRFLILGSIPLAMAFGSITLIHLYIAAFLTGVCQVVFAVAVQTAITRVVQKDQIAQAFGQYEAVVNTSSLIGPAVGGFLYQMSRSLPFLVDAISYLVSAITLLFVRTELQERESAKNAFRWNELVAGVKWLLSHRIIRSIAAVRMIAAVVSGGQTLLLILLAKQFGANAAAIGIIFSTASVGVVVGSLVSDRVQKMFGIYEALILSRGIIAVALPLQFLSPNLIVLTATTALSYFAVAVYGTISTVYRLQIVPDELQGRVNGFHRMLMFGGLAIGGGLTGYLAEHIGLQITFTMYTIVLGVMALITSTNLWPFKQSTESIEGSK